MIKSKVEIHDKFSVVINVTYNKIFKKKKSKYNTVTYLFFADSLNINNRTYPSTKFYNDVKVFLKYDVPKYTLSNINKGDDSLLKNLFYNTHKIINHEHYKIKSKFKDKIKMFAATLTSLIREKTTHLIKNKNTSPIQICDFLNCVDYLLLQFRESVVFTIKESTLKNNHKIDVFYADEHISNVVELQLMKLFNYCKNKQIDTQVLDKIITLINSEQKYKKQKGYDSPKDKNINPEEMLFKRNQLKKHIESIFFLNQDVRKDGTVFEQTLLAIAAGLAMVFSTGIAFYYQMLYGNFTMPFFIALVVSYMLKDRIKGLVSLLFLTRSNSLFYNYKVKVTNTLGKKVGLIKENFVFTPLNKLEKIIKKHRQIDMVLKCGIEGVNEHVIQYKKKIVIYPKPFGNDLPDEKIVGLTDITRLNFHRFIQYMDDPTKDYILVKKGEVYNKVASKVYHINIIQKHFTEEGVTFNRHRVIMNRNGIKRIENVSI